MEWWKGGDGGRSCDGGGSGSNGRGSGIVTVVLVGIGVAGGNINCETISSDIPIIMCYVCYVLCYMLVVGRRRDHHCGCSGGGWGCGVMMVEGLMVAAVLVATAL